jgi:plasmid stabilization system protein ParE
MLAKLARAAGAVPAAQRLRFLCAYAGDAEQARRWWQQLCAEAPRLARRDDTRMRRTAARDGRRFREVEHGVWRGYARQAVDPARVLGGASPGPPPAAGAARVEVDSGVWRVVYPRLSGSGSRRLWARANTLAARGLAPLPLALLSDPLRTLLVVEPGAGARPLAALACGAAERRAAARLLRELEGIGELRGELAPEDLALLRAGGTRLRAQLVAPHAFCFGGRAGGRRSRAVAARLLACLAPPPPAV